MIKTLAYYREDYLLIESNWQRFVRYVNWTNVRPVAGIWMNSWYLSQTYGAIQFSNKIFRGVAKRIYKLIKKGVLIETVKKVFLRPLTVWTNVHFRLVKENVTFFHSIWIIFADSYFILFSYVFVKWEPLKNKIVKECSFLFRIFFLLKGIQSN